MRLCRGRLNVEPECVHVPTNCALLAACIAGFGASIALVLPAPFAPKKPKTVPDGTSRVRSVSAWTTL